jgi:hypothetical protein
MNKMKNKYYTVVPFPKYCGKTETQCIPLTHIHDFPRLGALDYYLSMDGRVDYRYISV